MVIKLLQYKNRGQIQVEMSHFIRETDDKIGTSLVNSVMLGSGHLISKGGGVAEDYP